MIDVCDGAAAIESPVFVQIRREDGMAGVVLKGRRRRPVAAPLITVTLAASDRIVELPAGFQGVRSTAATWRTAELDGLWPLAGVREEARERLDVGQHVPALVVGQARLPPRHRRPTQPFIYRAEEIGIGGQLAARCRTDLVDGTGEITGRRNHVLGGRAVTGTVVAVTSRAPFRVYDLSRGRVLREGARSTEQYDRCQDQSASRHGLLPAPCSVLTSQVLGFHPV